MKAIYRKKSAYPGNPFIEAMPEQMKSSALMTSLTHIPKIPKNISLLPSQQRASHTTKILETFFPLSYSPLVYNLIYQGMISSYASKKSFQSIQKALQLPVEIQSKVYLTQAVSASILGVAGVGKSSTIARILATFPQVIEHSNYKGNLFFCKQITYLNIQTPNDCSVKSCCIQIFAELDLLLGTSYAPKGQAGRGQTVDAFITRLSQLCITHHIGIIVIDEIQNIVSMNRKSGYDSRLIRFFVQLMNDTGVSILLVGTPEVGFFFDKQPHLARRTRGLRINPLDFSSAFEQLLNTLWAQQVVKIYEPLSEQLGGLLYEISNGVPALLAQALHLAQQLAISSGQECLNEKVLRETALLYQLQQPSTHILGTAASSFPSHQSPHAIAIKEITPKGKGRPKAYRDADDIISIFEGKENLAECFKERGWLQEMKYD